MLGILLALGALLFWTVGDFFIQKTSRTLGIWKALFFITALGAIVLFPFIQSDLSTVLTIEKSVLILSLMSVVMLFAALFDFEALKEGKFAIIEPILGIELPVTVGLGVYFLNEQLSSLQLGLIAIIFVGIVLAVTTHFKHLHYHRRILERGVIFAGIGSVGMALANFLTGVSSQVTNPLMTIWFMHTFLAIVSLGYLMMNGNAWSMINDLKKYPKMILTESVCDNLSWIFYAAAMTLIPISIATAISEGYIAFGALLGVMINKEKLKKHQVIGIILTITGVIALAMIN